MLAMEGGRGQRLIAEYEDMKKALEMLKIVPCQDESYQAAMQRYLDEQEQMKRDLQAEQETAVENAIKDTWKQMNAHAAVEKKTLEQEIAMLKTQMSSCVYITNSDSQMQFESNQSKSLLTNNSNAATSPHST